MWYGFILVKYYQFCVFIQCTLHKKVFNLAVFFFAKQSDSLLYYKYPIKANKQYCTGNTKYLNDQHLPLIFSDKIQIIFINDNIVF